MHTFILMGNLERKFKLEQHAAPKQPLGLKHEPLKANTEFILLLFLGLSLQ